MKTIKLTTQPLTSEAFRPYGKVIGGDVLRIPDFISDAGTRGWQVELDLPKPLYMTLSTPPIAQSVSKLERHFNITQTFLPLGGSAAALAVAKPTIGNDLPRPEEIVFFLLDGSVGFSLEPGTWHALDRIPIANASTHWLMITDMDTQADLANLPMGTAKHTQVMDLHEIWGVLVELDLSS